MKNGIMARQVRWLGHCLFLGLVAINTSDAAQSLDDDCRRLAQVFRQLDVSNRLFDVGNDFVIAVVGDGRVTTEFQIVPKHYLQKFHPEWTEPDSSPQLTAATFATLLKQIEQIRPLGALTHRGTIGLASNTRAPYVDFYEHGVVKRTHETHLAAPKRSDILNVRIVLFRNVVGKIDSLIAPAGLTDEFLAFIDRTKYWVPVESFKKLTVGAVGKFRAAGPVDFNWTSRLPE